MNRLFVICKIGGAEYAVPAEDVYQMEAYVGATPVPGAPTYVAGLIQIRQQIIPVLDMRIRFGLEATGPTLQSRVIVLRVTERLVGIIVDSAREVQNIDEEKFREAPQVVSRQSSGFVKSIAQLKDRIIMLLDAPKVIGEEVSHHG